MSRYRRADGVLAEVIDGRAALVNPAGTELVTLNPTGTVVWEALAEPAELDHVVTSLVDACDDVDRAVAAADAKALLDELAGLGLVLSGD